MDQIIDHIDLLPAEKVVLFLQLRSDCPLSSEDQAFIELLINQLRMINYYDYDYQLLGAAVHDVRYWAGGQDSKHVTLTHF